jgi:death-on-curing family protein
MENIRPALRNEYERWKKKLSETIDYPDATIKLDDVLRAHFLICDYFIEEGEIVAIPGPRDEGLLCSALMRPFIGYQGKFKWNSPFQQVATLFYGLIKNHPFYDGNKRTALLIALYYLLRLKRWPTVAQKELETLTVRTASNELDQYVRYKTYPKGSHSITDTRVQFIADYFRKNTRREDKKFYLITYKELNTILHQYGLELKNPQGNHIDVIKKEKIRKGFLAKKVEQEKRVIHIGFPGWTKEVSEKDVNLIREAAGLINERGVDSQAFYKTANPMAALISKYHGPLLRLKDK